jgi:archaellum component FlaC
MTKHISDSERLTLAMLNKKETELKQTKEELEQFKKQLKAMSGYITELKDANKMLASQVRYLVSKQNTHA